MADLTFWPAGPAVPGFPGGPWGDREVWGGGAVQGAPQHALPLLYLFTNGSIRPLLPLWDESEVI